MKVQHLTTFPYGGAAVAARRIHNGLRPLGIDSRFRFFLNDRGPEQCRDAEPLPVASSKPSHVLPLIAQWLEKRRHRRICRLYDKHLLHRTPQAETFSMAEHLQSAELSSDLLKADILHLHWIAYLADYPRFFQAIPSQFPVIWTLHDLNPFTGGCHFNLGCERFRQGCGICPQIHAPSSNDLSAHTFRVKQRSLASLRNLTVVSPSQWLLERAKSSPIWPQSTDYCQIPYGLNLDIFRPRDRREARALLGLPQDGVLVGFGADQIQNPRKGFSFLAKALSILAADHPELGILIFGSGEFDRESLPVKRVHKLGFVDGEERQAGAFNACDLLVVPSLDDNQPQTALEAMACGIPVVGFESGGIPEIIGHGDGGLVVPAQKSTALASAIGRLAEDGEWRRQLGIKARMKAEQNHSQAKQARAYQQLYEQATRRCR